MSKVPAHRYELLTWEEARAAALADTVVLLPIGAVEQHGPHLPLDVDINLAVAVADRVAADRRGVLVAPGVPWGLSAAHLQFAGTLSLSAQTMTALLTDLADSLARHGFRKIAFVVAHNSNRPLVSLVAKEISHRHGLPVLMLFCTDFAADAFAEARVSAPGGELHAGELETAVELHLRPDVVRMDRAVRAPVDAKGQFGMSMAASDIYGKGLVQVGFDLARATPSGVLGDPTVAVGEVGQRVFDAMVEGVSISIDEYQELEW
ncbi:creatininase family protein [Capillimicrobium parvum]|uniref:Creatinine amidohydrolase n=1 Tax=Capillimicrobium parvum TaxID=2884022 RepID=A0A9E6XWZ7_9ACTN|nr:creatininase family protein [Capillimicrobium parvum]UGS35973.1 Creatinine amidohydrolase [Capillimicrobium parvum]